MHRQDRQPHWSHLGSLTAAGLLPTASTQPLIAISRLGLRNLHLKECPSGYLLAHYLLIAMQAVLAVQTISFLPELLILL